MKRLMLLIFVTAISLGGKAQFTKGTLQATGLTCAMCSNAINKALQKVPFIESVRSDIQNSAFNIVFKTGNAINIDALKDAVEGAGFSVGSLQLTGHFEERSINKDEHARIGGMNFHFIGDGGQVLKGEQTLTVLDKDYMTAKAFKKLSGATRMACFKDGKAASCCTREGMQEGDRVYHVRI
jgi:copper chaperone CopZ